jgi:DNA-binding CsgD family transcriptional regulator
MSYGTIIGAQARGDGRPPALAPRERETLLLLAEGLTHGQAAARMGVRPGTLDTYLKRIRVKLGPGNTLALVHRATERGLL